MTNGGHAVVMLFMEVRHSRVLAVYTEAPLSLILKKKKTPPESRGCGLVLDLRSLGRTYGTFRESVAAPAVGCVWQKLKSTRALLMF